MLETLAALSLVEWAAVATIFGGGAAVLTYVLPRRAEAKKKRPKIVNKPVLAITGRENEVTEIEQHFAGSQLPVIISGPAAIGKTVLAEAYADYAKHRYHTWVLLPLTSQSDMATRISGLAKQGFGIDEANAEHLIARTFQAMAESGKRWLVILDNADSDEEVARAKATLNDHKNIDFIITSQIRDWFDVDHKSIDLRALTPENAITLLAEKSGLEVDAHLEKLAIETLQSLPHPITLAAAELRETGISPENYQVNFERLLDRAPGTNKYQKTLNRAIEMALERLDASARELLNLAAYMHPDDIDSGHILRGVAGIKDKEKFGYLPLPEPLKSLCADETNLRLELSHCEKHSLLTQTKWREDNTLRMHRTTQAAIRASMDAGKQAEMIGLAARLGAAQMIDDPQYDTVCWPACHRLAPHAVSLLPLADMAQGEDAKRMDYWLSEISLFINHARQDLDLVLSLNETSLSLSEAIYGTEHTEYSAALSNLAIRQNDLGKASEGARKAELDQAAEDNFNRAIQIDTEINAPPLKTAYKHNNLAGYYWARKRFEDAEKQLLIALKIDEDHEAEAHILGTNHNNLGTLYSQWADHEPDSEAASTRREKALMHKTQGLKLTRDGLGPIHPNTAIRHNNLAAEHHKIKNSELALDHIARAVAILLIMVQAGQIESDHHDLTHFQKSYSNLLSQYGKTEDNGEKMVQAAADNLIKEQIEWKNKQAAAKTDDTD